MRSARAGCTGPNRLASNSLLECFVFGEAAAQHILANPGPPPPAVRAWDESRVTDSDEEVVVQHNWREIRRFMWDYVGIVRTNKRLERAGHRIALLRQEVSDYYGNFRVTSDLIELRNLVEVADLIVRSALARHGKPGAAFQHRLAQPRHRGARHDPHPPRLKAARCCHCATQYDQSLNDRQRRAVCHAAAT